MSSEKTLRWARGREGCSESPLPTSGLHPPRNATTATAASGGNREQLLGQRPARRECRPRHEADAGSRNLEETFRQFCFGRTAFLLPAFPLNRGARLRMSGGIQITCILPLKFSAIAPDC